MWLLSWIRKCPGVWIIPFILLGGCAQNIVALRSGYDLRKIQRVALLGFDDYPQTPGSGNMVASIFEKSLLMASYRLVERRQVHKVLQEQHFALSGNIDPKQAKTLGRILGVDGLLLGTVDVFAPENEYTVWVDVTEQTSEPIVSTYYTREPQDDQWVTVAHNYVEGYNTDQKTYKVPQTQYNEARVGFTVRMVDVETGEIVWVGSSAVSARNVNKASDTLARRIVDTVKKLQQKSAQSHPRKPNPPWLKS